MKNKIFKVAFWMTRDCNLKCNYCYEGDNKDVDYMNENIALKAIEYTLSQIEKLEATYCLLHFHGGEPLLAFDRIKFIMESIKDRKIENIEFHYSITTNGTIMDNNIKNYLIENFNTVSVSIDGNMESHDSNRVFFNGKGSHEIALKNSMELMKEQQLRIRMTVTPDNVSMLYQNVKFLIDAGFKQIVPTVDYFSNLWSQELIHLFEKELFKIKNYLDNLSKTDISVYMVNKDDIINKGNCYGGITNINIDTQGNIYPCTYTVGKKEFICGTIFNGVYPERIKEILDLNNQVVSGCIGCNYYIFCPTSSCKLLNKCITGDFLKASPVICSTEALKLKIKNAKKICNKKEGINL